MFWPGVYKMIFIINFESTRMRYSARLRLAETLNKQLLRSESSSGWRKVNHKL